jgi:hypothetical protein
MRTELIFNLWVLMHASMDPPPHFLVPTPPPLPSSPALSVVSCLTLPNTIGNARAQFAKIVEERLPHD